MSLNWFNLVFIATVIFNVIAGVGAGKSHGSAGSFTGIGIGILSGVITYLFLVSPLIIAAARYPEIKDNKIFIRLRMSKVFCTICTGVQILYMTGVPIICILYSQDFTANITGRLISSLF